MISAWIGMCYKVTTDEDPVLFVFLGKALEGVCHVRWECGGSVLLLGVPVSGGG